MEEAQPILHSYTKPSFNFVASVKGRFHGGSKNGDDTRLRLQCSGRFLPRSSNACCRHEGILPNPTKVVEGTVVGGVTLNHLSWAAALGAPTGLLALQGDDELGNTIRKS